MLGRLSPAFFKTDAEHGVVGRFLFVHDFDRFAFHEFGEREVGEHLLVGIQALFDAFDFIHFRGHFGANRGFDLLLFCFGVRERITGILIGFGVREHVFINVLEPLLFFFLPVHPIEEFVQVLHMGKEYSTRDILGA